MAVTAQEQATHGAPEPRKSGRTRLPAAAWSTESQLSKTWPVVKLLAEIWAVPEVAKVGLRVDEDGIQIRVLMAKDDRGARAKVYDAERAYLNGTSPHSFSLRVSPVSKAGRSLPPAYETVLER
jgi:hypothetical protein